MQPVKINLLITDLICQVAEKIFADKLGRNGPQTAERSLFKGVGLQGVAEESMAVLPFAGKSPGQTASVCIEMSLCDLWYFVQLHPHSQSRDS